MATKKTTAPAEDKAAEIEATDPEGHTDEELAAMADKTRELTAGKGEIVTATTKEGWFDHYRATGLSFEDALHMAERAMGEPERRAGTEPDFRIEATPGNPTGDPALGPDPALVAAYHERMENYVEPTRQEVIDGVQVKARFIPWIDLFAAWQTQKRRLTVPMSRAEAVAIMVGEHWNMYQTDRAMLEGTAHTGPADHFNAGAETWVP